MTAITTTAAERFIDEISASWDSSDPYVATAEAGYLAEVDEDALRTYCGEAGEDYDTAANEVLAYVRERVARMA